jgi:hypothetical protein
MKQSERIDECGSPHLFIPFDWSLSHSLHLRSRCGRLPIALWLTSLWIAGGAASRSDRASIGAVAGRRLTPLIPATGEQRDDASIMGLRRTRCSSRCQTG